VAFKLIKKCKNNLKLIFKIKKIRKNSKLIKKSVFLLNKKYGYLFSKKNRKDFSKIIKTNTKLK